MLDDNLLLEIADFIAGLTIQMGNILKIKKRSIGWLFSLMAIAYWIVRAHTTGFTSQTLWHMVSFIVAFFGYIQWKKQELRPYG